MENRTKMTKYSFDATDIPLGRLATQVAMILMGKNKPDYTPHIDNRNKVIITNASKIKLTGNKLDQKNYWHHSGYPGGIKKTGVKVLMAKDPEEVIRRAVKNMIPKNKLHSDRIQRLAFK